MNKYFKYLIGIVTLIIFGIIIGAFNIAYNSQYGARVLGGESTINLQQGKKLITATWKAQNFWYIVRDRRPNEPIETYEFKERSMFGVIQGVMIINEH